MFPQFSAGYALSNFIFPVVRYDCQFLRLRNIQRLVVSYCKFSAIATFHSNWSIACANIIIIFSHQFTLRISCLIEYRVLQTPTNVRHRDRFNEDSGMRTKTSEHTEAIFKKDLGPYLKTTYYKREHVLFKKKKVEA